MAKNPFCNYNHYMFFFDVSMSTAQRMLTADKKKIDGKVSFKTFNNWYGGFSDPKFTFKTSQK